MTLPKNRRNNSESRRKTNVRNKKSTSTEKNDVRNELLYDVFAIIFITSGLLLLLAMFNTNMGLLGDIFRDMLIALVGIGAYAIPFILIFEGVILILQKSYKRVNYGILMFIVVSILVIQMSTIEYYYGLGSFFAALKGIINSTSIYHGGIIGYILTLPFYKLLGNIGSYFIFLALYLISILITFNITIGKIFGGASRGIKRGKENINSKIINTKEIRNQKYKKDSDEILDIFDKRNKNSAKVFDFDKSEDSLINENIKVSVEEYDNKSIEEEMMEMESNFIRNTNTYKPQIENENIQSKFITKEDTVIKNETNKIQDEIEIENYKSESDENLYNELKRSLEKKVDYKFPEITLLKEKDNKAINDDYKKELVENARKLSQTLKSFGVDAKVSHINNGPTVTRYELQPSPGVKVSKIVNLSDDIALNLAARSVRIEAPVPGKAVVGIEVPNKVTEMVYLSELIGSKEFQDSNKNIAVCLGKDISGNNIVADLSSMPHVLIAGSTGSGKSVCINTLIISILYKYSPEDVKMILIDPKVVELSGFNEIPHLLIPVVTDPKKAAGALNWAVNEMTRRYKLFADNGVKNIGTYNELFDKKLIEEKLPFIVIIVDELADLMMVCSNDIDEYIGRLAQMARAAGMHLVLATQRPSVDVITGVIKANIPSRVAFSVSSQIDSRTILDTAGAEKLLGKGDMLYCPSGQNKGLRVQGAFISEEEVFRVVEAVKNNNNTAEYKEEIIEHINNNNTSSGSDSGSDDIDELYLDALQLVVESKQASTSLIQRKLKVGYNRAARIMDELESNGIISEKDGIKPRNILITKEDMYRMTGMDEY